MGPLKALIEIAGDFEDIKFTGFSYEWNDEDLVLKSNMHVYSIYMGSQLANQLADYATNHNIRVNDVIQQAFNLVLSENK